MNKQKALDNMYDVVALLEMAVANAKAITEQIEYGNWWRIWERKEYKHGAPSMLYDAMKLWNELDNTHAETEVPACLLKVDNL